MTLLERFIDDLGAPTIGDLFVDAVWPNGEPGRERHNARASATHEGVLEVRTLLTSATNDTPAAGVFTSVASPVSPVDVVPSVRMGDLFTRVPAGTSGAVAYVRELNPASTEGGASAVAEGDTKPEGDLLFAGGNLPIGKFAVAFQITREILDDAPGLRDFVNRRGIDYLRRREEVELLDGSGSTPHITGLRQTTGVQTVAFATSVANTVALAIAKVQKVYGPVDSVVIDQDSFWTSMVAAPTFWSGLIDSLHMRVLVMSSNVIGANKALVGAFRDGAVIRERDTQVAFSEDHSTNFVNNKIAVRAERREALIVNVPSWFADATLV